VDIIHMLEIVWLVPHLVPIAVDHLPLAYHVNLVNIFKIHNVLILAALVIISLVPIA
jgi:hypothetical protein